MTFGSLFSGTGGLDLGLERSGMTCKWQVELDDYCTQVLEKNWPRLPRYRDIHDVGAHNLEPVDLICGGFPCQPVSLAGKSKGQDDERWLWPEMFRVVRDLQPKVVLVENVPGLLTRGMGDVLRDLAEIWYDAEWCVLSAKQFGAPHLRKRVFLVATANADSPRAQVSAQGVHSTVKVFGRTSTPRSYSSGNWWATEPGVGRVVDGLSHRVDRLRGLGNAVVPQIAEWVGCLIMQRKEEDD